MYVVLYSAFLNRKCSDLVIEDAFLCVCHNADTYFIVGSLYCDNNDFLYGTLS